jgi:hypothetical protein
MLASGSVLAGMTPENGERSANGVVITKRRRPAAAPAMLAQARGPDLAWW